MRAPTRRARVVVINVRTATGAPVANARVAMSIRGAGIRAAGTANTDRSGRIVFERVRAKSSGIVTATVTSVTVPAGYRWDGLRPSAISTVR
jgi:hypothetical protein